MNTWKYEYQSEFVRHHFGQGKTAGVAEMVLELLTTRFGALSPAVAASIQRASAAELKGIAQRVLTAQTLDEALAPR